MRSGWRRIDVVLMFFGNNHRIVVPVIMHGGQEIHGYS